MRLNTRTSAQEITPERGWKLRGASPGAFPCLERHSPSAWPWQLLAGGPSASGHRTAVSLSPCAPLPPLPCLSGAQSSPTEDRGAPGLPQGMCVQPRSEDEGNGLGNPFFGKARATNLPGRAVRWRQPRHARSPSEGSPAESTALQQRDRAPTAKINTPAFPPSPPH